MKIIFLLLVFLNTLFGDRELSIASYNVENLFDLTNKGYRYKEYKPNTASLWNKKNYNIKLDNIAKVIKDIDADIIALQEIHSLQALKDLRFKLKQKGLYYRYYAIADKKPVTITQAILSKVPFIYSKEVSVTNSYKFRNIQEVKFKIDNSIFYLFNNHWKAKSGPESMRIKSAKFLKNRIDEIGRDKNIILVGDFNSDYEEYIRFKKSRRHNDTNGYTGINHILNTISQTDKISKVKYDKDALYNLWYDVDTDDRFSLIYKGKKDALDNIIISQPLLQKSDMFYEEASMHSVKYDYLFYRGKYIYNWKMSKGRVRKHKGKGYSDHLPVMAKFIIR